MEDFILLFGLAPSQTPSHSMTPRSEGVGHPVALPLALSLSLSLSLQHGNAVLRSNAKDTVSERKCTWHHPQEHRMSGLDRIVEVVLHPCLQGGSLGLSYKGDSYGKKS